jgi:hypothetical protein
MQAQNEVNPPVHGRRQKKGNQAQGSAQMAPMRKDSCDKIVQESQQYRLSGSVRGFCLYLRHGGRTIRSRLERQERRISGEAEDSEPRRAFESCSHFCFVLFLILGRETDFCVLKVWPHCGSRMNDMRDLAAEVRRWNAFHLQFSGFKSICKTIHDWPISGPAA